MGEKAKMQILMKELPGIEEFTRENRTVIELSESRGLLKTC
jgi:hypothetical protein